MGIVKTINSKNYDANSNILVETSIKEDDSIPSNLIDDGWALRTKWCSTNEEDYSKYSYVTTINNIEYQGSELVYNGSEPNIKTLDTDFIQDNRIKTKYIFAPSNRMNMSSDTTLKKIKLSNRVEGIGGYTFNFCYALVQVIIPTSVVFIGYQAFSNTPNLTSITYKGTIAQWNNINLDIGWEYNSSITVVHCSDGDISI